MNTQRVLVLGVAALAAGAAALLARGLLGGGTPKVTAAIPPPRQPTVQILVAAEDLQPGAALVPASVRWQVWPKSAVDPSFITHDTVSDLSTVVKGTVARAPLVSGEPVTTAKIVHADSAGIMAAMVGQGMRAVSIGISTESGAGGFILPNDRVDVLATEQISDSPKRYASHTLFNAVRVLAVDQTYREDKNQKVVLAKTATLELSPHQAEQVERAQAAGVLSLSLRALGDDGVHQDNAAHPADPLHLKDAVHPAVSAQGNQTVSQTSPTDTTTVVISYGFARPGGGEQGD